MPATDSRIAIIGLGYVGLPLAISFVEAGCDVLGVDANPARVAELAGGRSPIDDIEDERLQRALAGENATTDVPSGAVPGAGHAASQSASAAPGSSAAVTPGRLSIAGSEGADLASYDVIFVCVPTPINEAKDPDLGPVLSAASLVRAGLRAGQLVILQSTTFPGTTSGPFREELERSGLVAGRDFDLAFAPERVNPGDPASHRRDVPRLVGGLTPAGTARAGALLRRINSAVH